MLHDFQSGQGADVLQGIVAGAGSTSLLSFQWDQPWFSVTGKGSASDLDIYFVDDDGNPITLCDDDPAALVCQFPGVDENEGGDAVEVPALINDSDEDVHANIVIELFSGPAPRRMKYVWFDLGAGLLTVEEHNTESGTLYGHANAAGAEAIGAAPWYNTAAFGPQNKPECAPACLELFSSAGGVPILFDKNGRRFPFPLLRIKPGFTGPDGGNTTFFIADIAAPIPGSTEPDGFPNFRHVRVGAARGRDRRIDARSALAGHRGRQTLPGQQTPAAGRDVPGAALVGSTAGHQATCRSGDWTDTDPELEGVRFRLGLRLRGCSRRAAADGRLLAALA